jgi:hypothetical protein
MYLDDNMFYREHSTKMIFVASRIIYYLDVANIPLTILGSVK